MLDKRNTNILSLEGKDIINAGTKGYNVSPKKKYAATMDYSLEALKLDEVAKTKGEDIFYIKGNKQYTDCIVSLGFDYAVKEFDQKSLKKEVVYVKHDCSDSLKSMKFTNGLYIKKDIICAIKVDVLMSTINDTLEILPKGFSYDVKDRKFRIIADKEKIKTISSTSDIREQLYVNGFNIIFDKKTVRFIRYKRSSGSSRIGNCLFIREDLYEPMMNWSLMGLSNKAGEEYDMAGQEAYISLTISSIIDTLQIDPKSILLIPDRKIKFKDTIMATTVIKDENDNDILSTDVKINDELENNIWDGQSLLCSTIFGNSPDENLHWVNGKYHKKGFLLLRNRFFKSACFQCDIQKFFKDNDITSKEQLNGQTLATDIKEIKLITTPSSIKFLKYGTWDEFIKQCSSKFGIVKFEKPTHYFNGDLVQSHYQLINTLQLSSDNIKELVQPSLDYIKLLKRDIRVLREHLHIKIKDSLEAGEIKSTDDLMFALLELNNKVQNTDLFFEWRQDMIENYIYNMLNGHILIPGTYAVLCGNGMEMLKATIKDKKHKMAFNDTSLLKPDEIHCSNFDFGENDNGKDLLACRSPHTSQGNLWLCKNVKYNLLDKYFYQSPNIIHVNSIKSNIMERLSSCDFDSDSLLLTDLKLLLDAASKNYNKFLVPTSKVVPKLFMRENTLVQKAELDTQTSVNKIGDIVNLSQLLVTKLWDIVKDGDVESERVKKNVDNLYKDICQLSVMSTLEIDKAKRETKINIIKEMEKIRDKWISKTLAIENIAEKTKRNGKKEIKYKYEIASKEIIDDYENIESSDNPDDKVKIDELLKKYTLKSIRPMFFKVVGEGQKYCFIHHDCPMDYLQETITLEKKSIRAKRRQGADKIVTIGELFGKDIKVSDANHDQAKKIIQECKELKEKTNLIWSNDSNDSNDGEKKYLQANALKNEFIERVSGLTVSVSTIKKIIFDLNKESKLQKGKNGEPDIEVKKEINKFGRMLLSVLYKAHTDKFLEIFIESKENIETIRRIPRKIQGDGVISLYGFTYMVKKS